MRLIEADSNLLIQTCRRVLLILFPFFLSDEIVELLLLFNLGRDVFQVETPVARDGRGVDCAAAGSGVSVGSGTWPELPRLAARYGINTAHTLALDGGHT